MPSPAGSFLSPERLRRARLGAALLFLVNGAVFANLLPRLPQIKDAFELSNSVYGFVVIAFPLGSLLAGTAPAPIMRRWGSGRTAVMGSVAIALMILLAGVSGGIGGGLLVLLAYIVPLMLAGMLDAITDTAQNAQALDVQRAMGRSILNSMHALWSLGSVIGGLMGTAALALQVPLAVHLAISGILFSAVAVFAGTRVLTMEEVARVRPLAESSAQQDALPADGPEPAQDLPGLSEQDAPGVAAAAHEPSSGAASAATASPGSAGPARRAVLMLLLISVVSITGVMVEDLGQTWSALYLSQV
ncbi:MFS transporter, partial [Kocuria palustris]|uniref:MFS transporter n=1 Tax=Kocuria palustris TaxID=71999 RepID=UPI0028D62E8A